MDSLPSYTREELESIICYPRGSKACLYRRLVEAGLLRVKRFIRRGDASINGIPVLGKGTTAVVVAAVHLGATMAAVKVRRVDSNRPSMLREAYILRRVNSVGVGPQLLAASKNMILWKLVEGIPLTRWLKEQRDSEKVRRLLASLLHQLYEMDRAGITHGELARPDEHILVENDRPVILDFESASLRSKKSNVTQFLSILLREGEPSDTIRAHLSLSLGRGELRDLLRSYKRQRNLKVLLKRLGLNGYFTSSITT